MSVRDRWLYHTVRENVRLGSNIVLENVELQKRLKAKLSRLDKTKNKLLGTDTESQLLTRCGVLWYNPDAEEEEFYSDSYTNSKLYGYCSAYNESEIRDKRYSRDVLSVELRTAQAEITELRERVQTLTSIAARDIERNSQRTLRENRRHRQSFVIDPPGNITDDQANSSQQQRAFKN